MRRVAAVLMAAAALVAGCGGDDDGDAPAAKGGPAKTAEDARIEGREGARIAEVTTELLNAPNGDDPCYAIVASDYVESLGGLEGCARKLAPIATGPLDTITAARQLPGGETGEARVESADGSRKQTIELAKTVAGEWRIDGLGTP
ncbi:MAG: hypothetical protein M3340_04145 [Actinomycetota bacterium]|nr:hypothetical protein [Actinomycetota bacterium]